VFVDEHGSARLEDRGKGRCMAAHEAVIRDACICSKDDWRQLSHEGRYLIQAHPHGAGPGGSFVRMGLEEVN
jgi:hypothetical protein